MMRFPYPVWRTFPDVIPVVAFGTHKTLTQKSEVGPFLLHVVADLRHLLLVILLMVVAV